jgi:hypothetical protein
MMSYSGKYLIRRTLLALFVFAPSQYASCQQDNAVSWLLRSMEIASEISPSGVYEESQQVRLQLLQARGWALSGDVERTLELLPAVDGNDAEWASGGGGMVRLLLFNLETSEVLRSLLKVMVNKGQLLQALDLAQIVFEQRRLELYMDLGLSLDPEQSDLNFDVLDPEHKASVQMGRTGSLLAMNLLNEANAEYKSIDESFRAAKFERLSQHYLLNGDLESFTRLAQIDADRDTTSIMAQAAMLAGRSFDPAQIPNLNTLINNQSIDPAQLPMIALAYLDQGQVEEGRKLLLESSGSGSETWEHVAIRTGEHEWLHNYYQSIKSPWRRSERYFQYALRLLKADEHQQADRIAVLSLESAQQIPSASTRGLALRLLSEYHSQAGNLEKVAELVGQIETLNPPLPRDLSLARIQLAISQMASGDAAAAREILLSIEDQAIRITGWIDVAGNARDSNPASYDDFVAAAREDILSHEQSREQQSGWSELIAMQTKADDLQGARQSADIAATAGHGAAALDVIVDYQISKEDFDNARNTIESIPAGIDTRTGGKRRQKAMGRLLTKLIETGNTLKAKEILEQMERGHVRELHTPQVLQALVNEGSNDAAEELLASLKRSDMMERALAIILYDRASRGELPDPVRHLARVPRRRGAVLCWAATAAIKIVNPTHIDTWIDQLPDLNCQAFALAGAAYGIQQIDNPQRLDKVFELVDPTRTEKRMARAMQESMGTRKR